MTRMAWGAGLATIDSNGSTLDTWYRWLGWGEFGNTEMVAKGVIDQVENNLGRRDTVDPVRNVTIRPVRISIDVDEPPASPEDAYLRLRWYGRFWLTADSSQGVEVGNLIAGYGSGQIVHGPAGVENLGLFFVDVAQQKDTLAKSGDEMIILPAV